MNVRISISAWKTLAILGSTKLFTMYGETMLIPAIPDIIREFNISYNTSAWILTSYLIAEAVMTPIAGKLSDIYGRKEIVVIIIMIYIVGISIGGLSPISVPRPCRSREACLWRGRKYTKVATLGC